MSDVVRIEFECNPPVDGSAADVFIDGQEVGTMVYSKDLDQWNDCLNPGDVADQFPWGCAYKMIEFYRG